MRPADALAEMWLTRCRACSFSVCWGAAAATAGSDAAAESATGAADSATGATASWTGWRSLAVGSGSGTDGTAVVMVDSACSIASGAASGTGIETACAAAGAAAQHTSVANAAISLPARITRGYSRG